MVTTSAAFIIPPTVKSFSAIRGAVAANIAFPPISASSAIVTAPLNVPFPPIFSVLLNSASLVNSAFPDITLNAPVA